MSTRAELLAEIERFVASHRGMSETKLGSLALKDTALVLKLRHGRSIGIDTLDKLRAFMSTYQTKDDWSDSSSDRAA